MLRLLDPHDYFVAQDIANLKDRHSGTASSPEALMTLMEMLVHKDPKTKFIGYFEDSKLVSWMAVRFGTLGEEKVWVILGMYTSRFHNHFSWSPPEVGQLVAWAFNEAEATEHYAYLYTIATRLERVYDRQWQKNPWIPPTGRYTKEVVARVPANTLHELAWLNRMAHLPKPDDISVLKRALKKEHR